MVELPEKKVGIIACSGEELPEGTAARLAALKVLEQFRPANTVTICLPLFLAGGEGDRAFARFYPTIAVDGCNRCCAARGTEMYSNRPAASLVVSQLAGEHGLGPIEGRRQLNPAGRQAVDLAAQRLAGLVDEIMSQSWNRRSGVFTMPESRQGEPGKKPAAENPQGEIAPCACGSGIPVQKVMIAGQPVGLVALPFIFEQFYTEGKLPAPGTDHALLEVVKIYNPVPAGAEDSYVEALQRAYQAFCAQKQGAQPGLLNVSEK